MRNLLLATLLTCAANAVWAEGRVAFFGITFIDSSLRAPDAPDTPPELARIAMLEDMVVARFIEGGFDMLDTAPVQADIDRIANPAKCYGCDTRAAKKLGADFALVGEVQKVSDLILAMNLQLRDAETGNLVKGRVVDIRGNTDASWQRGMRYILKTTFFAE